MESTGEELREAFVDAYPRYVAEVLVTRGIEMTDLMADAIVEGANVLNGLLTGLEGTSFIDQRQSPLELFREALRPVARALHTAGVEPSAIDSATPALIAWDTYQLSPASSAALGTAAHEAHLRWGVEKARALGAVASQSPRAALIIVCSPEDRDTIGRQAIAAGFAVVDQVSDALFAVIDVDGGRHADSVVEAIAAGCRTVVFGSEIEDMQRAALRAQGVWKIVDRPEAIGDLSSVLPRLV